MFLSQGNRKCSKMWIFNLPAIKACPNHSECAETCYALKAQRIYPTARKARESNFRAAKRNMPRLEKFLCKKIGTGKYGVVRIHESGDFFSQAYIDMWARIAWAYSDIDFFAFTKVYGMFNLAPLTGLPNVRIHNSFIGGGLNYGDPDYIRSLRKRVPGLYLCEASASVGGKKCNIDCTKCITGSAVVVFHQH